MTLNTPSLKGFKYLPAGKRVMDAAQHRRHLTYTQRIQKLRKILPLMVGAIFLLIVIWPEVAALLDSSPVSQVLRDKTLHIRNLVLAPRMQSTDDKGRPYFVTAKSALQKNKQIADLEAPQSNMQLEDGTTLKVEANSGLYNDLTKVLEYKDNVKLLSDTGYDLRTSLAHVHLNEKRAFGDQPVEGEGPAGKIWAEGFQTHHEGILQFTGKSRLIIDKEHQAKGKE